MSSVIRNLVILMLLHQYPAHAEQDSGNMRVAVKMLQACRIRSIEHIIFAGLGAIANGRQTMTGSIIVRCSSNTGYSIGLNMGENVTNEKRAMKAAARNRNEKIRYDLYYDPAYSNEWFDSSGHRKNGQGNGVDQEHTVYAKIFDGYGQAPAGLYKDQVMVSLEF